MKYRLVAGRAVFNAVGKSVDFLAGLVVHMRNNKKLDCDLVISKEQYKAIKNNNVDATFFAIYNVGLICRN